MSESRLITGLHAMDYSYKVITGARAIKRVEIYTTGQYRAVRVTFNDYHVSDSPQGAYDHMRYLLDAVCR